VCSSDLPICAKVCPRCADVVFYCKCWREEEGFTQEELNSLGLEARDKQSGA